MPYSEPHQSRLVGSLAKSEARQPSNVNMKSIMNLKQGAALHQRNLQIFAVLLFALSGCGRVVDVTLKKPFEKSLGVMVDGAKSKFKSYTIACRGLLPTARHHSFFYGLYKPNFGKKLAFLDIRDQELKLKDQRFALKDRIITKPFSDGRYTIRFDEDMQRVWLGKLDQTDTPGGECASGKLAQEWIDENNKLYIEDWKRLHQKVQNFCRDLQSQTRNPGQSLDAILAKNPELQESFDAEGVSTETLKSSSEANSKEVTTKKATKEATKVKEEVDLGHTELADVSDSTDSTGPISDPKIDAPGSNPCSDGFQELFKNPQRSIHSQIAGES